jgi:hypothetical protein
MAVRKNRSVREENEDVEEGEVAFLIACLWNRRRGDLWSY